MTSVDTISALRDMVKSPESDIYLNGDRDSLGRESSYASSRRKEYTL
jgi:hypothetical protein